MLALLFVLIAGLLWTGGDADPVADRLTPVSAAILDHVRHGQDFYAAAIDALRENGRPLRPVLLAVPLPALPVTLALMPPLVGQLLLVLLGLAVVAGWARRCWPLFEGAAPAHWRSSCSSPGFIPRSTGRWCRCPRSGPRCSSHCHWCSGGPTPCRPPSRWG
ncbi:hypothetical protein GCM10020258_29970 [Sphingomonas yabuuchiae]